LDPPAQAGGTDLIIGDRVRLNLPINENAKKPLSIQESGLIFYLSELD
jgi:hypothetical protein